MRTLFIAGLTGLWGLFLNNDWTTLLIDIKVKITFIIYILCICFSILIYLVTTIQEREKSNETIKRAHGKKKII